MSAYALDDSGKIIKIPDELESLLHVLLYVAIRFLPHNCVNVAAFMSSYFDDSRNDNLNFFCGEMKKSSMTNGKLEYAPGRPLTFLREPPPKTLSWPKVDLSNPAAQLAAASGTPSSSSTFISSFASRPSATLPSPMRWSSRTDWSRRRMRIWCFGVCLTRYSVPRSLWPHAAANRATVEDNESGDARSARAQVSRGRDVFGSGQDGRRVRRRVIEQHRGSTHRSPLRCIVERRTTASLVHIH